MQQVDLQTVSKRDRKKLIAFSMSQSSAEKHESAILRKIIVREKEAQWAYHI